MITASSAGGTLRSGRRCDGGTGGAEEGAGRGLVGGAAFEGAAPATHPSRGEPPPGHSPARAWGWPGARGTGGSKTCAVSVLVEVSALKGTSPTTISYRMQPSAYMSTR